MRAAQILGGRVVNVVVVENLEALPDLVELQDGFGLGDTYAAGVFSKPAPAVVVPQSITALQGLLALDAAGLSTPYEEWANAPERTFAQRAFIGKAMTWRRDDPTLLAAAVDFGLSAGQVDELFVLAATL